MGSGLAHESGRRYGHACCSSGHLLGVVHRSCDSSRRARKDASGHSLPLLAVELRRQDLHDLGLLRGVNLA